MTRTREQDACPGALTVHRAADGALVRIRLPGGMITSAQIAALAEIAEQFGSPAMELTSRGNVQIRAVTDTDAVAAALTEAGLLPSPTHERARNIVASPLSGRSGGVIDIRPLVTDLDRAIQADPALAGLPGRFWFSLDDGRGDVSGIDADAGVHARDDGTCALLLAGRDTGVRLDTGDAVATLIEVARRFVAVRGKAWRITELDDHSALLDGLTATAPTGATWPPTVEPPVGWIEQRDAHVTLGAGLPLGVLQARVAHFLAAIEAPLVITPWRSVLVCDVPESAADASVRVLAPLGLVFDENSPWLRVSACTGTPGCAKSAADVRADAAGAVPTPSATHRHFVGCERACGSPPAAEVLVATEDGYRLRITPP
ncbi:MULTISPECIES: precorrin-3B synthase [unclassified Mycolicibacterium]|uniref:precorrin-3B synthase n=2 Tax=Mycolicibacterium TaxID=1866885 RepID=UPI0012DEF5A1|nr:MULTISPECIES: precorrin-3B synthase [unclassified Mycolicibacterium]MUL82520.1 precorrin-3B synthase [Mycolicibacterium sp. CBMA 329]MUL91348.1 precorrin-3B synthase [Mycolicibacterium sp. CBMA 331]MUM01471.1 precorrin-3B synthase [Mycolicibacterium sp. CBMA 334]MUM41772.1 precorrin-3B synthase [Mycolicibacterium sp. CBMA 247]MUM47303.1 precorrin-3B synthase [Mycolicibacterium sp. CBMA 294]